jgi:hypothetical protein
MAKFPTGGWDLDDYDSFIGWAKELKLLDRTKALNEAIMKLFDFAARLEKLNTPLELDDNSSEGEAEVDLPATTSSTSQALGTIRSRPRAAAVELATNDPKVAFSDSALIHLR